MISDTLWRFKNGKVIKKMRLLITFGRVFMIGASLIYAPHWSSLWVYEFFTTLFHFKLDAMHFSSRSMPGCKKKLKWISEREVAGHCVRTVDGRKKRRVLLFLNVAYDGRAKQIVVLNSKCAFTIKIDWCQCETPDGVNMLRAYVRIRWEYLITLTRSYETKRNAAETCTHCTSLASR